MSCESELTPKVSNEEAILLVVRIENALNHIIYMYIVCVIHYIDTINFESMVFKISTLEYNLYSFLCNFFTFFFHRKMHLELPSSLSQLRSFPRIMIKISIWKTQIMMKRMFLSFMISLAIVKTLYILKHKTNL